MLIDNTQYTTYLRCPYLWFEKYVNRLRVPQTGERDDPLAIGVAVHDALEQGYRTGQFYPTTKVLDELGLSSEAMLEVRVMAEAYRAAYPSGPVEFKWHGLEAPISYEIDGHEVLAKLDGFFEVEAPTTVSGGVSDIHLEPGIYSFETKTKIPGFDRGLYEAEWQSNSQASFQLLTLKANAARLGFKPEDVKGVLVNVIERPTVFEPRRTCQSCGKMFMVKLYTQVGKEFECPSCRYRQAFKGPIKQASVGAPYLWRLLVTRSEERLAEDEWQIRLIADSMEMDATARVKPAIYNRNECVILKWKRKCEFYEPHNALVPVSALDWMGFEKFNPIGYLGRGEEPTS